MFGKVLRTENKILTESQTKTLQLRFWVKHCQITANKKTKFPKKESNFQVRICISNQIIISMILTLVELA